MKQFRVYYWTEKDDVSTDCEKVIDGDNENDALTRFKDTTVYRKIEKIEEI